MKKIDWTYVFAVCCESAFWIFMGIACGILLGWWGMQ